MANDGGVLVIGEEHEGHLSGQTTEMLGLAHRMVHKLGGKVQLALLGGGDLSKLAAEGGPWGAEKVYVAQDASLAPYQSDAWAPVIDELVKQADPAIVLIGQTSIGRDLGPRIAFRLDTGVSMDTLDITVEDGKIKLLRPAYGGNARVILNPVKLPAVATVKAKAQEPLEEQADRTAEIVNVSVGGAGIRTKILGEEKAQAEGIRLEDAAVVVSGGRGLGAPEGFQLIEQLAGALGGAAGASRAACDLGWYPPSKQVGLTGTTVSPDLYVAVAISGASQHMAGMSGSKNIVAVNKDPDANMVKASRFAVIGDYKQVLPPLIEEVKKLKS
jgi:electron transfer flavoprotein alpha subunit